MKKKLIYFTLGNNNQYFEIANLCLESLKESGYDGDILFITDKKKELKNYFNFSDNVFFLEVNNNNLFSSSANKIKIYLFDKIYNYEKIIYSDLDILWLKTPNIIFELINKDKIYISEESSLMCEPHWGGLLLNNEEKNIIKKDKIKGLNAGFFAFNTNMIETFKLIDEFISSNLDKIEVCLEQPFINTFLFRKNLYEVIPKEHVSHNGYNMTEFNGTLIHFAGGPGNSTIKIEKMKNFKL